VQGVPQGEEMKTKIKVKAFYADEIATLTWHGQTYSMDEIVAAIELIDGIRESLSKKKGKK